MIPPPTRYTALVLAGARRSVDPLAEHGGRRRKALLPVAGVPMLARVVRTLGASRHVGRILVSIDEPRVLDDLPELRSLAAAGGLSIYPCGPSPSATVLQYLVAEPTDLPVLVTAADHPLLTPAMVEYFCSAARDAQADLAVGTVAARLLQACYPESKRTVVRFRDGGIAGANLFAFLTPQSVRAAAFWIRAERFRKRPWRLAGAFGPVALGLFALGRLDRPAALERASRTIGARIQAIDMPFAECAIDVDGPADLTLAARVLREREAQGGDTLCAGGQPAGWNPGDLPPPGGL